MFTKDGLKALYGWTHGCLDVVLAHAATLPQELFVKEVPGFGSASVRDQLTHVLSWESAWVHDLQDLPFTPWAAADHPTVPVLRQAQRQVMASTLAYLDRLSEAHLNTDLARRPANRLGPLRSPAFILHHVVTHAFHHKGQIAALCRILGHPAPDTDLQR